MAVKLIKWYYLASNFDLESGNIHLLEITLFYYSFLLYLPVDKKRLGRSVAFAVIIMKIRVLNNVR